MGVLRQYNDVRKDVDELSKELVDCFFKIHKTLGPGYLEQIYEDCLAIELEKRGIDFQRQKVLKIEYEGIIIPTEFRLDLIVDDKIVVELKAVEKMHPVYDAQIYSYLKSSNLPMGFLVNFNVPLIKDGIKRFVPKSS